MITLTEDQLKDKLATAYAIGMYDARKEKGLTTDKKDLNEIRKVGKAYATSEIAFTKKANKIKKHTR